MASEVNIMSPDPYKSGNNVMQIYNLEGGGVSGGLREGMENQNEPAFKSIGGSMNQQTKVQLERRRKVLNNEKEQKKIKIQGYSLFLFGPQNCIRKFFVQVANSNKFEGFIILLILISSIMLVIDDPMDDPNSQLNSILNVTDVIMSCLFLMESLIKIMALGFLFNGPNSFLRSIANILDAIIVSVSMIDVFNFFQGSGNSNSNLSKLKILRILRVLRPLRLVSRNEGL